jgi:hypothetical protein
MSVVAGSRDQDPWPVALIAFGSQEQDCPAATAVTPGDVVAGSGFFVAVFGHALLVPVVLVGKELAAHRDLDAITLRVRLTL